MFDSATPEYCGKSTSSDCRGIVAPFSAALFGSKPAIGFVTRSL